MTKIGSSTEGIQYEGRDENGDKMYFVHFNGTDIGTFSTYDEAVIALRKHVEKLNSNEADLSD